MKTQETMVRMDDCENALWNSTEGVLHNYQAIREGVLSNYLEAIWSIWKLREWMNRNVDPTGGEMGVVAPNTMEEKALDDGKNLFHISYIRETGEYDIQIFHRMYPSEVIRLSKALAAILPSSMKSK